MSATWTPDHRPLFTRVVDAIVAQIRDGRLQPGDRVPSTRELADHYGVASMTALRAMRELQALGATYGVVGRGTFVRPDALARLHARAFSPDCHRCADEASYTKHLVNAIDRCHHLADQLATHPSREVTHITAEVRRLASILAGDLMDHAHHLDRSDERHRHDQHDEHRDYDDDYDYDYDDSYGDYYD
jgi:DNA-binding GntR family transcriptional regulator